MVANYHDRIAAIVVNTFRALPIGEDIDFVEQVAVPIPALVMAEFLGVPPADRTRFVRWANSIALIIDEQDPRRQAELHEDVLQMREYARFRLEQTKLNPGDDLLSALNAVELDGERLSEASKVMFAFAFLFAGNETTRHLISGTLEALADNPAEHARLVAEPGRSDTAIDELLRWVSPVIGLFRTATEDCEIGGQPISRHDWIYLIYASANRDESAFKGADRLDLGRDADHLAFGYGAHRCLGSNLARLEGRLVLRQLATDYRHFALTGAPERLNSTIFNGYTSMPARF
jgi:cytochrome P450